MDAVRSAAARMYSASCRTSDGTSGRRKDELSGAQYNRHLIIGLVRHTSGELADNLHPLGLPDPLLRAMSFGKVQQEERQIVHSLAEPRSAHQYGNSTSILSQKLLFVWRRPAGFLHLVPCSLVVFAVLAR